MSDLLTAAAEAMGLPEDLVSRSVDARAAESGSSRDEILTAWAGGAPVVAAPAEPAPPEPAEPVEEDSPPVAAPEPPPVPTIEIPAPAPTADVITLVEEEEEVEPVPLRERVRTATRVGAWTGAILGLFAFVVATIFWGPDATVTGEEAFSPVLLVDPSNVMIAMALVSIVLGAIVAGLSRAAAGWVDKGMRLSNSSFSTGIIGGLLGLALGLVAGALLTGVIGLTIEGVEGLVQLPVLATVAVMMVGGAVLGALTAAVPQLIGVPLAMGDDGGEVEEVKSRLGGAVGVPMAAALLLVMLVIPFAFALIESNELTSGGAAIIAIITAAGILAFASLGGSKPNMRLTFGEVMVALAGIATVVVVIFMVMSARSGEEHAEEPESEAAIVQLVS